MRRAPLLSWYCVIFRKDIPYKPLSFNNKCSETFYFGQVLRDLAWMLITKRAKVGTPKHKKMRPPGSQEIKGLSAEKKN